MKASTGEVSVFRGININCQVQWQNGLSSENGEGRRCGLAWSTYEAIKARCLGGARVSTPVLSAAGRPPTAVGGAPDQAGQLALKELQDFPKDKDRFTDWDPSKG